MKIIAFTALALLATSASVAEERKKSRPVWPLDEYVYVWCDEVTGIEWLVYRTTITPRLERDRTPRLCGK